MSSSLSFSPSNWYDLSLWEMQEANSFTDSVMRLVRKFGFVFIQTKRLFRGIENNEFKLEKNNQIQRHSQCIGVLHELCAMILPVIRYDKLISQHFVNTVFNFKFILLESIQITVLGQRFFKIKQETRWTQPALLPNLRTRARVFQELWKEFQNMLLPAINTNE